MMIYVALKCRFSSSQKLNVAMNNPPVIDDFPSQKNIVSIAFSIAMFDYPITIWLFVT
jgi:hypothetical protein